MPTNSSKKVLLIGWDAADWKAIHPLVDAGKMPNLAALIERGVIGNMATLQPALSPMLWTSIATGKRPYKHGVHGFSEPDPATGGIRPVTNLSRKTKAIWNILNQNELDTITVGWWPSNPAEPLSRGVMVSDDFQKAHGPPEPWPLKPHTIHPERLEKNLKELRFHPSELTEEDLFPFLPGLRGLPPEDLEKAAKDPRMQSLMKIIADCTSIHSAATALIQNEPWNLMCVYYDAIDHFGHAFMRYHPPQRPGVDDWEYRVFNHVVEAGYRYHDLMLGTLIQLAGEKTTVILMSDHGFHPDDFRLGSVPREPAGPAAEHRQFGIFAAAGPGIKKDERVHGASLLDITPTLLQLFGLPAGVDMDGKTLEGIFEKHPQIPEKIPSWDDVSGDHGMHPPDRQISAQDSQAALQQLVALGYIDEPDADSATALEQTVRELDYNLAQAYIDGGIFTEAVAILSRLYEKWPDEHRFGFKLATCYHSLQHTARLRETVTTVSTRRMAEAEKARTELEEIQQLDPVVETARIEALTDPEKEKYGRERRELIGKARPNLFSLRYLEASADFSEGKYADALARLAELDSEFGARKNALVLRGEILQKLRRWNEATTAFEEALAMDSESPAPLLGLARTALAQRKFSEAADYARASTGLLYFQPRAHYLAGLALYRNGDWENAEAALLTCVRQAPLASAAYRGLSHIAQYQRADPMLTQTYRQLQAQSREKAAALHNTRAEDFHCSQLTPLRNGDSPDTRPMAALDPRPGSLDGISEKNIITIVTGLPRSGTSLMMQILAAAGIPLFSDGKRPADESNQKGYHEHQKIAALLTAGDRTWLREAPGHALKIVAPLLPSLPPSLLHENSKTFYRVIFMEREMEEILASQSAMLDRLGKPLPEGDASRAYRQHLRHAKNWLAAHGIPALGVPYETLVHHPADILPQIADFLGKIESTEAMQKAIDPTLHRARATQVS